MVDLGDLASRTIGLLPLTSRGLMNAVDNAVVYKVQGKYRSQGKTFQCSLPVGLYFGKRGYSSNVGQ